MTHTADITPRELLRKWGFWAVLAGGLALALVFVQITLPSLETKPSAATQIGEIAGEIKRSAWRTFLGLPKPEAEPVAHSSGLTAYLAIVAPILGVIAIILALISGVLRENWRFAAYGASLGASAILFQIALWVALLIVCVVIFVSILENIGDIFTFGG